MVPASDGFVVHLGTQPGVYTETLELGPIQPDTDGIRRANLVLDAFTTYYLILVAYNAAGDSPPSEEAAVPAMACDAALCDDANPCTADTCDATGCTNQGLADGAACPDGMCVAGLCEPMTCRVDRHCDDGNVCNGLEGCARDGLCMAGAALACGLPTACSAPACDPVRGCTSVSAPDGMHCRDRDRRIKNGLCDAGVCVKKSAFRKSHRRTRTR
jgi:hypothetical protein